MEPIADKESLLLRPMLLAILWLCGLSLSRGILLWFFWDRVHPTGGLAYILLQGVRFDLVLVGLVLGPVFLLRPALHLGAWPRRLAGRLLPLYLGAATTLAFFVEASSVAFINQFDNRPNYLFVEYLRYPREVLATLTGTHLLELLGFTALALLLGWAAWRWLRRDPAGGRATDWRYCLVAMPLITVVLVAAIRSTLDHRPVNPSTVAFSEDAMVNQLPLNSPYTVIYAVYEKNRDAAFEGVRYGDMDQQTVLNIVRREAGIRRRDVLDQGIPTLHRQRPTVPRKNPLNLVIILQESLGADYVGSLGGKDLTPEIDALADDGIWFENLYATGVRSARGIEAVLSGFTPTHLQSVIKLAETQTGFFTLAELLRRHGYRTSFIYGGEAHFDNMKRFFLANGFETVIDENDFDDPVFHGSWGVSDEDTLNRAHEQFAAGGGAFFSLVFTTSNHEPWDIPPGRVTPSEYGPRETTIKYADWAVGRFFEQARASDYWRDTVFLLIADHNARVFGSHLVPVERYRIPGVILGGSIEPRRVPGVTSQIDMLPTLLSLIGLDTAHPGIGRDITTPTWRDGAGRAMMQFHSNQAYIQDDWVIILRPDLKPRSFRLDERGEWIWDNTAPHSYRRLALAHALFGPLMIRAGAYRLD